MDGEGLRQMCVRKVEGELLSHANKKTQEENKECEFEIEEILRPDLDGIRRFIVRRQEESGKRCVMLRLVKIIVILSVCFTFVWCIRLPSSDCWLKTTARCVWLNLALWEVERARARTRIDFYLFRITHFATLFLARQRWINFSAHSLSTVILPTVAYALREHREKSDTILSISFHTIKFTSVSIKFAQLGEYSPHRQTNFNLLCSLLPSFDNLLFAATLTDRVHTRNLHIEKWIYGPNNRKKSSKHCVVVLHHPRLYQDCRRLLRCLRCAHPLCLVKLNMCPREGKRNMKKINNKK